MLKRYKRPFLLLIIPIIIFPIFFVKARLPHYVITCLFMYTFILLLNYPSIIINLHSEPIHFERLKDIFKEDKTKFQRYFVLSLIVCISIVVSILAYYVFFRIEFSALNRMEIYGVIGGALSLSKRIEQAIGRCLSSIFHYRKKKSYSLRQLRDEQIKNVTVELQNIEKSTGETEFEVIRIGSKSNLYSDIHCTIKDDTK